MGYAARLNPHTMPEATQRFRMEKTLRAMLALFADRKAFEQWATARHLPDEHRAHLEQFLPAHLQAQGSV